MIPVTGTETLGEFVERNLVDRPGKPALIYDGKVFTYGESCGRALKLANALYRRGLRRQHRLAILAQNSHAYVEAYAACEVAGYIAAAVNYRLAPAEILYILKDSQPTALLFDTEYAEIVAALRPQLPEIRRYIAIGADKPDWAEAYEAVLDDAPAEMPPIRSRADDIAYIIYTSGTTGRPKGAMLDHRGQVGFIQIQAVELETKPDDRIFLVMPFYHIGAKCNQLAYSSRGATVVLHRNYDIRAVASAIETEKCTAAHLAPIMVQDLLSLPDLKSFDHSSLRLVQYASGPMSVAQLKRALAAYGPIFMQIYGMTETGLGTVLYAHEHVLGGTPEQTRRLASAGQVPLGYKVRVVRDDGGDCAPEELGEVLISGPGLMRGYWNNHPATLAAIEDGWMHTGDVGTFDKDRFLYVLDRKKDMIISGGENIYPREVEEAIYAHPAVAEVAVVGVPDERWGEAVKAFVVLKAGGAATEAEIVEHCRTLIASYKKPKSVDFIDALPRLPNKKIDKKQLRAPFWSGRERNVN
ncbi:MAG: long-chain-fatty-acid--CoA ligase [Rhodospirillaceae bacterium]|nr:long-chain-fatty-acid--CoA ligase [Rhodospirillaceae bacterium]